MNKEPAYIVMAILWVLNRIVDAANIEVPNPEVLEATAQFIALLIGALLIRRKVFSQNTLREAGLDPKRVQERAEDPSVPKLMPKK